MPPPPPQPMQQHTRINLTELKDQIVKKVGVDRAQRYFSYLNRLLGQKLSKAEFQKLCHLTLGRENLPLHNQLIRSILKNACQGKVPPPIPRKEVSKSVKVIRKKSPPKEDGYPPTGVISPSQTPNSTPFIGSNGDLLPMSPRKVRSVIRNQKFRDRPSPLGPNGKTDFVSHQLIGNEEAIGKIVMENGNLNSYDVQRPFRHHQGLAEQPENERDAFFPPPTKRVRKSSPSELVSAHSKGPGEVIAVEDGEEVEQDKQDTCANISSRSPLQAPLGIPFCHASVGGAHRALPVPSISGVTYSVDEGELCDTESLRKRMEQIAVAAGLDGVSLDCANFLNNGLDMYLKQLIRSCIQLVGARSGHQQVKHSVYKQQPHGKLINGLRPGHQLHLQSNGGHVDVTQESKGHFPVSLLDFKVAMELNPQQLGENWPVLLEKICLHSFEE